MYQIAGNPIIPFMITKEDQFNVDKLHLSYIYYKIHSFYICNTGNTFIHVSGLHILNGISVQN